VLEASNNDEIASAAPSAVAQIRVIGSTFAKLAEIFRQRFIALALARDTCDSGPPGILTAAPVLSNAHQHRHLTFFFVQRKGWLGIRRSRLDGSATLRVMQRDSFPISATTEGCHVIFG
jgi:hypothetical protein